MRQQCGEGATGDRGIAPREKNRRSIELRGYQNSQ